LPAIWRPDPYQNWTFTSEQTMIYQDTPARCWAAVEVWRLFGELACEFGFIG